MRLNANACKQCSPALFSFLVPAPTARLGQHWLVCWHKNSVVALSGLAVDACHLQPLLEWSSTALVGARTLKEHISQRCPMPGGLVATNNHTQSKPPQLPLTHMPQFATWDLVCFRTWMNDSHWNYAMNARPPELQLSKRAGIYYASPEAVSTIQMR